MELDNHLPQEAEALDQSFENFRAMADLGWQTSSWTSTTSNNKKDLQLAEVNLKKGAGKDQEAQQRARNAINKLVTLEQSVAHTMNLLAEDKAAKSLLVELKKGMVQVDHICTKKKTWGMILNFLYFRVVICGFCL